MRCGLNNRCHFNCKMTSSSSYYGMVFYISLMNVSALWCQTYPFAKAIMA